MAERNHQVDLIEDGGINPEARSMDVESKDNLPPVKPEDVFRNIEAGLKEAGTAMRIGNTMRAKVQLASVKTLISMGSSIAQSKNDVVLLKKLEIYKAMIIELELGRIPSPLFVVLDYCSNCGREVEKDASFCGECGVALKTKVD